jgi:catechol 2,3-dioxygenase-like lactoylglutathione lyase family enzyme
MRAMAVELNHTIVHATNGEASANFLADLLGLPAPRPFGPVLVVQTANGVSLDFIADAGEISRQHYAFLVSEAEFDQIFGRIQERGLTYWADPRAQQPNEINTHDGGRGLYFRDPSGHWLEIITRPYGGASA